MDENLRGPPEMYTCAKSCNAETQIYFNEVQQQFMTPLHLHREIVRTLSET